MAVPRGGCVPKAWRHVSSVSAVEATMAAVPCRSTDLATCASSSSGSSTGLALGLLIEFGAVLGMGGWLTAGLFVVRSVAAVAWHGPGGDGAVYIGGMPGAAASAAAGAAAGTEAGGGGGAVSSETWASFGGAWSASIPSSRSTSATALSVELCTDVGTSSATVDWRGGSTGDDGTEISLRALSVSARVKYSAMRSRTARCRRATGSSRPPEAGRWAKGKAWRLGRPYHGGGLQRLWQTLG